jgi:hypothetical protein
MVRERLTPLAVGQQTKQKRKQIKKGFRFSYFYNDLPSFDEVWRGTSKAIGSLGRFVSLLPEFVYVIYCPSCLVSMFEVNVEQTETRVLLMPREILIGSLRFLEMVLSGFSCIYVHFECSK